MQSFYICGFAVKQKIYWEQEWKRKHIHNSIMRVYDVSEHIMGVGYYACSICKIMICKICMKESPVKQRETHLKCFAKKGD